MSFKKYFALIGLLLVTSVSHAGAPVDPDADYDRMDGTGLSGKKVNVIEWEGNLEIHVYPGGSLKGLALKLDKKNKDRPVMVIGYRFDSDPKTTLIRRAILGIDLREGFKAYRDPSSGGEYDKIIISNNGLSGAVTAYRLDAEPTQLYPDGHPALAAKPDDKKRAPASASGSEEPAPKRGLDEDSGAISPFFMNAERQGGAKR
jgi:hypothetical protein